MNNINNYVAYEYVEAVNVHAEASHITDLAPCAGHLGIIGGIRVRPSVQHRQVVIHETRLRPQAATVCHMGGIVGGVQSLPPDCRMVQPQLPIAHVVPAGFVSAPETNLCYDVISQLVMLSGRFYRGCLFVDLNPI